MKRITAILLIIAALITGAGWSADTGAVISYPDSIENISDKLY